MTDREIERILSNFARGGIPTLIGLDSKPLDIPSIAPPRAPPSIYSPQSFDEYIGQAHVTEICSIIVDSANINETPIPNILLFGPYGLGKTTLARLIMERHGREFKFVDATTAAKRGVFKGYMIIDEIHNLPAEVCDQLNTLLDQDLLHLVGCTTNPGALPAPFRSRFRLLHLESYEVEDIFKILKNSLDKGGKVAEDEAVLEISKRSRLNPRTAIQNLSFTLEVMTISRSAVLTKEIAQDALNKSGIDEKGLTEVDRKYLDALDSYRPTGLSQLKAVLGTNIETIEEEIEPFLIRAGMIERTPRGRVLTTSDKSLEELLKQSITLQDL